MNDVINLNYSVTIDVDADPGVLLDSSNSDAGRVPDCRPPDRVIVRITREIRTSKYFASDPLKKPISVVLSAALILLITRSGYIATQQVILPIRNESLEWIAIRVSREVVSEEPGTESHLGIFPQGGVQHLSLAVCSWQRSSGICGDHLHLHTKANTEIGKETC